MITISDTSKNYALSPFPAVQDSTIDKSTPEFMLQEAQAIWGQYVNNINMLNEQRQRDIINRMYAEGLQSIEKYKNMRGLTGPSYANLDLSPVNFIATTIDKVVGQLSSIPYKIQCNPIDPESKLKLDKIRDEMFTDMLLKPFSAEIEQRTGIPLVAKHKVVPESDEEAELNMQMNSKMAEAIAMEEAFNYVMTNNEFADSREQILRDLLTIKRAAVYRYYDEDWNIKCEAVDPVDVITPYSKYADFRNIPYIALIKNYTIGQIATMKNYTPEELYNIARNNAGRNNNPNWAWGDTWEGYYRNFATGQRPYYNFNIQVLEFFFLGVDKESREIKIYKKRKYVNVLKSGEVPNDPGSEIVLRDIQNVYEGKWIIGSKELISHGKMFNIPRERIKGSFSPKATLPIKIIAPGIYDMKNKSHVERMIPAEDQINLANLSLQVMCAKAKPPGVAVDFNGLLDVAAGMGEGIQPIDILKIYEQTGNLIYSSTTDNGDPLSSRAITELRGGVSDAIANIIKLHQHFRNTMNEVIGINPYVDPSGANPEVGLGVQDNAIQATNHSLRPIFNASMKLILSAVKDVGLMIQDCIEYENEAFMNAIGTYATKTLEYGKGLAFVQMGIDIQLLPDDVEKRDLVEDMRLGITQGSLMSSDVVRIRQMMKEDVKLAAQLLVFLENKNRKNKMAESAASQQQNAQVQTQSAQASAEAGAQADGQITQNAINKLQKEYEFKDSFEEKQFQRQMKLQELKNEGIETVASIGAGSKVDVGKATADAKIVAQHVANQGKAEATHIANEGDIATTHLTNLSAELEAAKQRVHELEKAELEAKLAPKPVVAKK